MSEDVFKLKMTKRNTSALDLSAETVVFKPRAATPAALPIRT